MKLGTLVLGAMLGFWATDVAAQTPAPWMGTWKLDVARSKFSPGPPPRSQIVKNSPAQGGGFDNTADTVAADGRTTHVEYYARPDGKEYPIKGGTADAIWVKTVDDNNNEWATSKAGKVVSKGRTSYSRDGKTRTLTWTSFDDKGQKFENEAVFHRQ
jgi:hypothetical protein